MMTATPDTPAKQELREKLEKLYNESRQMGMLRTGSPMNHMVDGSLQLITTHTAKAVRECLDRLEYKVAASITDEEDRYEIMRWVDEERKRL